MVKKVKVPPHKAKELEGFEEAMDLVTGEETILDAKKEQIEDYQIYDYLLKENDRLKKLDDLFSTKLKIMEKYDQIDSLIEQQNEAMSMAREEVISFLTVKNSPYQINMDQLFKKIVKSG